MGLTPAQVWSVFHDSLQPAHVSADQGRLGLIAVGFQTFIHVSFSWEGVHHWPDAQGKHAYLRELHRHVFQGDAWIEVFHDDRELEFFAVRDFIDSRLPPFEMGPLSCEQVAQDLVAVLRSEVGANREITVEVSEDGENGAVVEWTPEVAAGP